MKTSAWWRCGVLAVGALALGVTGCGTDVGLSGGVAVHYGPFRFWFHDGPWLDGYRGWHEGIVIHPPPIVVNRPPPWPRFPARPRPPVHHGR